MDFINNNRCGNKIRCSTCYLCLCTPRNLVLRRITGGINGKGIKKRQEPDTGKDQVRI